MTVSCFVLNVNYSSSTSCTVVDDNSVWFSENWTFVRPLSIRIVKKWKFFFSLVHESIVFDYHNIPFWVAIPYKVNWSMYHDIESRSLLELYDVDQCRLLLCLHWLWTDYSMSVKLINHYLYWIRMIMLLYFKIYLKLKMVNDQTKANLSPPHHSYSNNKPSLFQNQNIF